VAIAAERDQVGGPVVAHVAVQVVDLQRQVQSAAVAAAATVDREHAGSELLVNPSTWSPGLVLRVNGGGLDGGDGAYFANYGEDVHAIGSLAPIIDGYIGCIVIKPDGSRYVAQAVPDPLAE
jgi:hypothetical protein